MGSPRTKLKERFNLTERELDVAVGLLEGLSYHEIGERHGISYHTVNTHVKAILAKTGLHSSRKLVSLVLSWRDDGTQ